MEGWVRLGCVFLGGGLGSCARYLTTVAMQRAAGDAFPWGTGLINVLGSLVIGLFMAVYVRQGWHENWRFFFAVGVLGGFTTFSSFCYEATRLLSDGRAGAFAAYVVGSNALGLIGCGLGVALGKAFR